ncbi:hypothetical protein Tco_0435771 [Tanacetum coccineum]
MNISPIPTTRIYKDHPKDQIVGDINSATQTRRMIKLTKEHAMKVIQALTDPSWIEVMQKELLQFKLQTVWTLVDLPKGKRAIETKWVRSYTQEEGIDYDEVFAPVARIEAIRAWYETLSTYLLENGYRRGTIDKNLFINKDRGELTFFLGLQVMQKDYGIFISQDKYVVDLLKKFNFVTVKTTSTPIETNKVLLKDEEAKDVDVHLYRSMIRSLMYLTASRLDIMFAVCACARDSPFDLEDFSDSDYARASLDRKSTTGGCQFLGKRCYGSKIKCLIMGSTS